MNMYCTPGQGPSNRLQSQHQFQADACGPDRSNVRAQRGYTSPKRKMYDTTVTCDAVMAVFLSLGHARLVLVNKTIPTSSMLPSEMYVHILTISTLRGTQFPHCILRGKHTND
jgi:hypothetical protein